MVEKKSKQDFSYWNALEMLGQLGFVIAIPAAVFAYLGALLDRKYHTSPLFIIAGLGLAIFLSSLAVYRMIKKIEE